MTLGIVLLQAPRRGVFLMSEEPLYGGHGQRTSNALYMHDRDKKRHLLVQIYRSWEDLLFLGGPGCPTGIDGLQEPRLLALSVNPEGSYPATSGARGATVTEFLRCCLKTEKTATAEVDLKS